MDPVKTASKEHQVEVTAADLPLHCPLSSQKLWNSHPRVFLRIEKTGKVRCPYCGTCYVLKGGAAKSAH